MTTFLLLTSPPASGKTYWIERYQETLQEKILVISPLKALALEMEEKWKGKILVSTPEAYLLRPLQARVVIFDEWHLLFYWGSEFRENMWEAFYELSTKAELCIGLTATFSEKMKEQVMEWHHFDQFYWQNVGNQILKYYPQKMVKLYQASLHRDLIFLQYPKRTQLIFCEYREQVWKWVSELEKAGFRVLGCVGGETKEFSQKLATMTPQFIVSTTCLSHGVNLPSIEAVHFTYQVKNLDFWIQMVARGGRDGQGYDLYCTHLIKEVRLKFWTNLWRNFKLMIWVHKEQLLLGLNQWFLKESLLEKHPIKKGT